VTKEEVETAIGVSVTEPVREDVANLFTCSYKDLETSIYEVVGVSVFVAEREDDARDLYEMAKNNAADAETVAGIGDEASWDSILNGLEVLKGKYNIRIDVSPDGWDTLAIAKELAAKALGRLP